MMSIQAGCSAVFLTFSGHLGVFCGFSSSEEDIGSCNDPKFETCEVHTFFTSPDFCGITISSYIPKLHIKNPKSKKMPRTREG